MAASSSFVERWAPRLICCSVSSAKKRSTWLIQDEEVGVKWGCQFGRLANQSRISLVLWLDAVVHDDVDVEIAGQVSLDGIEKAAELGRTMTRHALADDRAGLHVERGEQRGRAVSFVVVGAPFGLSRSHRQQRRTLAQLAEQFDVHPNQITSWKAQLEEGAADVFGHGGGNGATQPAVDVKSLHAKIGELTLENDFLAGALGKAGLLSAKR